MAPCDCTTIITMLIACTMQHAEPRMPCAEVNVCPTLENCEWETRIIARSCCDYARAQQRIQTHLLADESHDGKRVPGHPQKECQQSPLRFSMSYIKGKPIVSLLACHLPEPESNWPMCKIQFQAAKGRKYMLRGRPAIISLIHFLWKAWTPIWALAGNSIHLEHSSDLSALLLFFHYIYQIV